MPEPSNGPIPPELALLEREQAARTRVEQRFQTFYLRPSASAAAALRLAIADWEQVAVPGEGTSPALNDRRRTPTPDDVASIIWAWFNDHDACWSPSDATMHEVTSKIASEWHR